MSFLDQSDEVAGNVGAASYTYSGDGDVTEVKLGVGWEPFKSFSIGIAAKYYWGKITHNYLSTVENNIVFRCKECCYQHHYGKHNTIRGNVFAFAGRALFDVSRREDRSSVLIEENTFISDGAPMYIAGYKFLGADFTSSKNTYWDLSGNEPLMIKNPIGDIYFKDWQEHYGYDSESIVKKPSAKILKKVTEK
jgi:hypothetical protein